MSAADTQKALDSLVLARQKEIQNAQLRQGESDPPFSIHIETYDLSVAAVITDETAGAGARKLGFPFKSLYVQDATDATALVNLYPDTRAEYQRYIPLSKKDSVEFPRLITRGFLSWAAQAGKTLTIVYFIDGSIRPGNFQVTVTQSNEGTAIATSAFATVGLVAAILAVASSTRKVTTIQNQGSSPIWLGDSGVTVDSGANPGTRLDPGQVLYWKNSAALYAIAKVSTTPISLSTET